MSNIVNLLLIFCASVTFLFLFYQRTKEDVSHKDIFKSGLTILAFMLLGSALISALVPNLVKQSVIFSYKGLSYWGLVLGMFIGLLVSVKKFKVPFLEGLDGVSIGFFILSALIYRDFISSLLGLTSFYYFRRKYKSFTWYKSGKFGFSAYASLGVFFLSRALLALIPVHVIAFTSIGKVDILISASISFLCFFSVYNLSEYGRKQ